MGEVYRARDTRLGRFVAIKVLSRAIHDAHGGRERFEREARVISRLSHPHICTIYDVGTAQVDGQEIPFLVLELLEGETLATRLARGPLSIADAVGYALEMADALASAHAKGIVHRDLKPANVMLTASGIKLLDFGLARLYAPEVAGDDGATRSQDLLTSAGRVIGTAPYMSPEQVEGGTIDARSDIFSFGSVLYELFAGRRAFPGDSGRPPIAQILRDDPPPVSSVAPAIPADLASIVARCLRKDRTRRYQNMADVKVALEEVRDALRSGPREQQTSQAGRRWRLAGAVLLGCAVVVSGYLAWPRATSDGPPAREVPLTTLRGFETSPTIAPDGEQVAFSWGGPNHDNVDIYIQRIGSGSEVRRTDHSLRDFSPAWSPDGRWIAFLRGEVPGRSELILIPPLGGTEKKLADLHIPNQIYPNYLAWVPDSSALIVVHAAPQQTTAGLFVVSLATREPRALTRPTGSSYHQFPAVSPDGRTVAFRNGSALSLLALRPDLTPAAEPRHLVDAPSSLQPTWTPDSKEIIYVQGYRLWRIDVTGAHPARPLPFGGDGVIMPAISRPVAGSRSKLIYVRRSADQNLWRVDLPALGRPSRSAPIPFPSSSTRTDYNPQLSPDGTRLAFQSDRSGQMEIWVSDADGANERQITAIGRANTGTPRWSPNGQTIAFDSNADGNYDIYVVPAGGGKPTQLTFEPTDDHVPSFSRDGKFVYFSSRRSGAFEIWKVPASGGDAVQVTRNGGYVAFESFDRRHVYYTQTPVGPSTLWRIPTAGGAPTRVVERVSERAFEVLKQGIYYIERLGAGASDWGFLAGNDPLGRDDRARLRFFEFASSKDTVLAELGERVRYGLAVSPNGRTVVFTRLDNPSSDLMMVENFR
jgi:Tol biopolymer transport system component